MVERIQLLASGIVPTVGWYCDEIHFSIAFLHLQLATGLSTLPQAQEISRACVTRPSPLVVGIWELAYFSYCKRQKLGMEAWE